MASKDIEKLKEKFDKDPNSKLFLPLAEEYRKEGMLDEAIAVLQQGLEKHAAYTSARVLLGKTYLDKGMMDEARKEFESVIKIVPDNLFAHKKLAELYRDTGETALAIKAFKVILKLNPMDEESINNLKDIEAALSSAPPQAEEAPKADSSYGEIRMPEAAGLAGEEAAEIQIGEEIHIEAPDIQVEHSEDELNAFKDSLFGDKSAMGEELESDNAIQLETPEEAEEAGAAVIAEDEVAAAEELSFDDFADVAVPETIPAVSGVPSVEKEAEEAGAAVIAEDEVAAAEELSFDDFADVAAPEAIPAVSEPFAMEQDAEETFELMDEPLEISEEPAIAAFEETKAVPKKETADLSAADRFVEEGKYAEAMGVYRKFLADNPDDKRVLQRVDELRALLKLMGKDKEVLIDKLNAFLEGIQKGRNGFLGHS